MTVVPAGAVAPRAPRPLTDAEKRRLRKQVGGYASPSDLNRLASKFAKPERKRVSQAKPRRTTQWEIA